MQKIYRLTRRSSFSYIYKKGSSVSDSHITMLFTKTRYGLKVGFSVSKKIGCAVIRNKVKRRLREGFRSLIPQVNEKFNIVVVARPKCADATYLELRDSLSQCLNRAKLFNV